MFALPGYFQATPESDYAWCLTDIPIQRKYGGQVCAMADDTIWGGGYTVDEAWRRAKKQPGCPARERLVFVWIPYTLGEPDWQ